MIRGIQLYKKKSLLKIENHDNGFLFINEKTSINIILKTNFVKLGYSLMFFHVQIFEATQDILKYRSPAHNENKMKKKTEQAYISLKKCFIFHQCYNNIIWLHVYDEWNLCRWWWLKSHWNIQWVVNNIIIFFFKILRTVGFLYYEMFLIGHQDVSACS